MKDPESDFFKAVGALGIHEPLRNAESVPAAAIATGAMRRTTLFEPSNIKTISLTKETQEKS